MNPEAAYPTRTGSAALWAAAALASVVFNVVMFTLLPGLVNREPVRTERMRVARAINVIRLDKPDSPVRKKEVSQPAEQPLHTAEVFSPPSPEQPEPVAVPERSSLAFDFHPAPPPKSLTLPSQAIRTVTIGAPNLKAVYGSGEIDRPLTPLVKAPPVFPMHARRRGIEGWVTVRFLVNETGEVSQVEVIEADPPGIFEQAVIRSVGSWRFEPGTVDGTPVKTRVETTVRFELQ